ncbi:hypothetical protein MTsPCn9_04230 [Croceitalea sp. MTPC9]|uniref:DUF6913 domain-containing protein n=1 Tax=unclassified Croceitalea TaxID=2632280 RepID=UPI002B3EF3D2|nr:hypothetical protein MTsPCn6_04480 [Croceitalea sp. MTPC6]GMN15487.1 hypothetical protein MTsPCn9_04230 [Croceitalea sp. MTPC9]
MIFRAIQDKFKVKSGLKYLEDELKKTSNVSTRKPGVSSIGCVVDMDKFPDPEAFNKLISDFSLQPNGVKIIGYKKDEGVHSPFGIQFFTDKDLGWNGTIENGFVSEFVDREYDVLINYYTDDKLVLKLLSVRTNARIKVGFPSVDSKLNDLIIDTSINNFDVFKTELKKYLKVLKEIK